MTIKLKGSTDGSVSLQAPADTSPTGTDITMTLPTTAGSANEFVKNSGTAGTLEYSSMVETSTGVGIGTTSPTNQLHIDDATAANDRAELKIQAFRPKIRFQDRSTSSASAEIVGDNGLQFRVSTPVDDDTNLTERMRIDSSGVVMIRRTTNPDSGVLVVDQDASAGNVGISTVTTNNATRYHLLFRNGNGQVGGISTNGSATIFSTSSDYRLKENVVELDGAIDRVKQLAPKRFNFIADADTTVDGFLAHEAQTVVPEAVTGTHNGVDDDGNAVMQGIDQSKLVPLLTAALQEAIAKIETLETKVAALEAGS